MKPVLLQAYPEDVSFQAAVAFAREMKKCRESKNPRCCMQLEEEEFQRMTNVKGEGPLLYVDTKNRGHNMTCKKSDVEVELKS